MIKLDAVDYGVLKHLQVDGRMPFTDIAKLLGVTSGTVRNRFDRLIENGVLDIRAHVDTYKAGFRSPAIVLVRTRAGSLDSVAEAVAEYSEVDHVAITPGDYDLDLTVSCRDNDHLLSLVNYKIQATDGVEDTRIKPVLKIVKSRQVSVAQIQPRTDIKKDKIA